jgi:branched-chain amino acid transport system permease protein
MSAILARRTTVAIAIVVAIVLPALLSDYNRSVTSLAVITGILILSLNLLTGFVGQISFCQFSFASLGAFTVGSLVAGHHWSFWAALPLGVLFAALGGFLVGIPALRLSGLFLAILTVGVALFFDRFLLAGSTWPALTGGVKGWQFGRPSIFGIDLSGQYSFYLFSLIVFALVGFLVWNLRIGKTGRVLRAVRESEVAASTMGLDLTKWKLAAFTVSAAIAGLAGGLLAEQVGSVSAGSYDFIHSIQLAAIAAVMGVGSLASAAVGGLFLIWIPELLNHTPIDATWFPMIVGGLLIFQLVLSPQGFVTKMEHQLSRALHLVRRGKVAEVEVGEVL